MSAPALQDPSLTWGVLSFVGPDDSEEDFEIEAIDGTHMGNPVPIIEVLPSLLVDGALAMVTGWENRVIPIKLRVSANDGEALSKAEAALFQQVLLEQPPPLQWTSPLGQAATTVFDTVVATLEEDTEEGWDLDEVMYGERFYLLTLTCLPFARAVESTTVPALPVPTDPGGVVVWSDIDTCGSTSGWDIESNLDDQFGPSAGSVSGETMVQVSGFVSSPSQHLRAVRTGSIAVPDDHYLAVDVDVTGDADGSFVGSWMAYYNGAFHAPVAVIPGLGEATSTRIFFEDVGTISLLKIAFDFTTVSADSTAGLRVFNVAYTDTIGSSTTTTARQQSRLVAVAGSAPTQAALRLYDATPSDLGGDILVYTTRSDVPPNLRQWIDTSESAAPLASGVSGSEHTLNTPTKFLIPANLLHQGSYALLARMDINVEGTLSWQARMTTLGGAATIGSGVIVSGELDLAATTDYEVLDLAAMILPVVEIQSTAYAVELTLTGTIQMKLDEAWLFSLDEGVLTWVKDTEGLDWIEIRSPELGAARPSVWGGPNLVGTGGSCVDWKCLSFGPHRFDPGTMQIFTVTTESLKSQCEIEFFPRYHSNVWGEETA